MNEFDIIKKYFQSSPVQRSDVTLGSGDDCALLKCPVDQLLAVSVDTLISGVHFPHDLDAEEIAYKSVAVSLSDLAAMGAEPAWFTCALTLSQMIPEWFEKFAKGLFSISKKYQVQLVGGNLTRGNELSITVEAHGFVPEEMALKRGGAKIGDNIYISGKLGYGVLKNYYHHIEPRISLGLALRGKAHSAIDISDGLIADLSHILESSEVGAAIYLHKIPVVHEEALFSGDDYELCFTGPESLNILDHKIYCIGKIESQRGLRIYQQNGSLWIPDKMGYQHF